LFQIKSSLPVQAPRGVAFLGYVLREQHSDTVERIIGAVLKGLTCKAKSHQLCRYQFQPLSIYVCHEQQQYSIEH